jgi:RNA polymerase sigma-70 factor (ECF subfamily)
MAIGEDFDSVLAAARSGAEWAIAMLYRDLQPWVLRFLRAQAPSEAEDLDSETWLDVARGLHRFGGGEAEFRRWVFTIARRRLIDHRRAQGRRRTDPAPLESLADRAPSGNVEEEAMARFSTEAAVALIRRLPPEQAEVVLLRVLGGFSAQEVGRIVGKKPGTVRVLQHRALLVLAKEISPDLVTS